MLISVDKFIATLSHVELMMEQACSLLFRFPHSYELVNALLIGEVKLDDDYKQSVFAFLDTEHQKTRSQPAPPSATVHSDDVLLAKKPPIVSSSTKQILPTRDELNNLSAEESHSEDGDNEKDSEEEEVVMMTLQEKEAAERADSLYREEDEPFQSLAKPTEREYILRFNQGGDTSMPCSLRMGCLVNEADTFPTTRAVRVTFRAETPDINS